LTVAEAHGLGMRPKALPQLLDEPQSLLRGKLLDVDGGNAHDLTGGLPEQEYRERRAQAKESLVYLLRSKRRGGTDS